MIFPTLVRAALTAAASAMLVFAQTSGLPNGIDPAAIDRSVNPCDNFYQFSCGTWMANNPIPSDQSRWGRFPELAQRTREILRGILEKAADEKTKRTPLEQKIGDYYASCMDEKTADEKGSAPVRPELDRIASMKGKEGLAEEVARLHSLGVPAFFSFGNTQDPDDASKTVGHLAQGGLGMPDRDFYLKTGPKPAEIRDEYRAHVAKMFRLAGWDGDRAEAAAKTVLAIETALATASADRVTLRDPQKRYHRKTLADMDSLAPAFDWSAYLRGILTPVRELNVGAPDFVKGLHRVIADNQIADLKTYLEWRVLDSEASALAAPLAREDFDFNERVLNGVQEMPPRWKQCVIATDKALGEALGRKYVEQTFGAEGKERTLRMVTEIEAAMARDIRSIGWMSDATKEQALTKLRAVANKIGYPDRWQDYSALRIVRGDAVGNRERSAAFGFRHDLDKIGKPADKNDWTMTPPTVNAYYSPAMNNINFPAGILQPPFYFRGGDEAANYGAIGAVVGHELTHGFDDSGRQYDGAGNLRDWWTVADAKNFEDRARCIVNEYGNFSAAGSVMLNGKLTLGENGADNGGVRLAYMALMDSLANRTLPLRDGFTPEQRFFLAYGQVWCENTTDEAARMRALTDPHSPGRYRVNGVLQNMPEFQKAFGCQAGQPMVSPNSCRVW